MRSRWLFLWSVLLVACAEESGERTPDTQQSDVAEVPEVAVFEPAAATLHRLTQTQYRNSLKDLLGPVVVVPDTIEPDTEVGGFLVGGASDTSISPWGVEQFEVAAFSLAEQAMADIPTRTLLVDCEPAGPGDSSCARQALQRFARLAYRRPVTTEEIDVLVDVSVTSAKALGDFHRGLAYAMAAVLQSPSFLFRVETGEPVTGEPVTGEPVTGEPVTGEPVTGEPAALRYSSTEMASRLSYFLWNTTPDEALIAAAESGALTTDAGLSAQVDRMLAHKLAHQGVRNLFTELYKLYKLDNLSKDALVFHDAHPDLGATAREETLLNLESLVFEKNGDFRDFFTNYTTYVDRRLAAIYEVPAPTRAGFGKVELPHDGVRRGFLGQVSFLALYSHSTATSATLRGKFIREVLLCGTILPPPADVNTSLPEPDENAKTLRDRVKAHLEVDYCAGCHLNMDPIGLGLEQFDGIGRFRLTDNGAEIDPAGNVDGADYADPWELAIALRNHPEIGRCLVQNVFRYATGHVESDSEDLEIGEMAETFESNDFRVLSLLKQVAMSKSFRLATAAAAELPAEEASTSSEAGQTP